MFAKHFKNFTKKEQKPDSQAIEVKTWTWLKESHCLFDYESKNTIFKKNKLNLLNQEYKVNRSATDVQFQEQPKETQEAQSISQIINQDNQKYINPLSEENFLVVRSLKNNQGQEKGYNLQLNDLIKLGRIEYQIVETKDKNNDLQHAPVQFLQLDKYQQNIDFQSEEKKQCKICFEENNDAENPLLSPCSCKGSCEFVHFECLKYWIDRKVEKKVIGSVIQYKWRKFQCEVCHTNLPKSFNVNNQIKHLVEIEKPNNPYIILERISRKENQSLGIVIISSQGAEEGVKFGRGHQCDIRNTDISISRFHAYIKYVNGNFVIFDNNSKFGTLVRLNSPYPISEEKIAIQIDRTVMTFVSKNEKEINLNKQDTMFD